MLLPVPFRVGVRCSSDRAHRHRTASTCLPDRRNSRLRLGATEQDVPRGGSDRLAEALVAHGDEAAVADRVQAYLDAGADHVRVPVVDPDPAAGPRPTPRRLAPTPVGL